MTDIAIVGYAQSTPQFGVEETETQMLFPAVNEALDRANLTRKDIGFTCSASCDYLSGAPFAFVQTLEVTGAWPPISESHVEMDGAWALYEAWVRLHHGDIDTALVFASGITSRCDWREVSVVGLDPYYLMPLWPDNISLAALQAQALITSGKATEKDFAEVAARIRGGDADALLKEPYVVEPLRAHDTPTMSDGGAAIVLAVGDKARELCERPAWISGIDHRVDPHYPGTRDLSVSHAARIAAEQAGVGKGPIEVAELAAQFSHEELILREALGLGNDVEINPSGGALKANPVIATGLVRIGEAANQIIEGGRKRVLGHASAGPCLQQNLVCVLEGDE
ncbi:MAG TPA: thiolase domain-containing protein [Actinomycetota bacterium]|nr:thiolase domain-containing protein [Actinomycetota bacterium]